MVPEKGVINSNRENYPELEHEAVDTSSVLHNALRKTEHFKISRRDTIVNDLKNSTKEGLASFAISIVSLLLVVTAVLVSYYQHGQSRALIGLIPIFAFVLAVGAVIFAIFGFRRKDKVRHYMEKRGLVIALVTIAVLIAVFVRGLILFLGNLG